MLNKPTWSLSNNRFNPILVGQEIRTYGYPGPYLGFFVCGGKLGFREISDQYSYKKQPSKIRHYVRKKTFSFPGGGNCPLRPPAMYGPDTVEKNREIRNHWHPVASVILVADCLFISHWAKTEKFFVHVYFVIVIAIISSLASGPRRFCSSGLFCVGRLP